MANKPNYTRRAFTALAAGAVLAMLLLAAAGPAFAQTAVETPYISYPANNSVDNDGDIVFSGLGSYDMLGFTVDLYEDLPEGPNKVGTGTVYGTGSCFGGPCDCESGCMYDSFDWSISVTGVADGTHTYHAVVTDFYGNVSDPSNTVTVVVDRSIPPTVDYTYPDDGVTTTGPVGGVSANFFSNVVSNVSAHFDKKMDPNTLTTSTFTLDKNESDGSTTPVDGGTVDYDTQYPDWLLLKLPSFLEGGTKYTATIKGGPDGVKDEFGIPLAEDYVWSFTTATWPTVDSVSPSDGATQVPTNTNVTVTFSKDMKWYLMTWPQPYCTGCIQRFTLVKEGSTTPVDAVVYNNYFNGYATKKATMDPSVELEENTKYTATVKGEPDGVLDEQGNPLVEDYVWSFTTSAPSDTTPPETTITSGPNGPTNDNTPTFSFSGSDDVSAIVNCNTPTRWMVGPGPTTLTRRA